MKKKLKYEKPKSLDIGGVASVLGAGCSPTGADTGAMCDHGDSNSGLCYYYGASAGMSCDNYGSGPGGNNVCWSNGQGVA